MTRGIKRISECHPEVKHKAFGLCVKCYERERRLGSTQYKEYQSAYQKVYRKMHPEIYRDASAKWWRSKGKFRLDHVKRLYGITPDDYWCMFEDQEGLCAICHQSQKTFLCVDHDHETGIIRGLLCRHCNTMLGYARENPETLRTGASYLEDFARGRR